MARPRTVRLALRARLAPPDPGYDLHAVSADPYDAALAVWSRDLPDPGRQALVLSPGGTPLRPAWVFPGDETEPIDDRYTLTLTGTVAWSYYYSAFPITRIADGQVTAWQTEVDGARALLVSPTGDLTGDAFVPRTTTRLTLGHRKLPERTHLVTRGPTLHAALNDAAWTPSTLSARGRAWA